MTRLFHLVLALIVALGCIGVAVYAFGDRSTFVPPPESVAEELVKGVVAHRYGPAATHLSDSARQTITPAALDRMNGRIEAQLGRVLQVRGEPVSVDGSQGRAAVVVEGTAGRSLRIGVELSFTGSRVWKVDRIHEP